jgi:predicted transcriptional regulator of viral defense system
VFQVVTDARLRDKEFGRVRIAFYLSSTVAERPTVTINTPTGTLTVAAVETTVLDLAARTRLGGGISNVATIIGELIDDAKLDIVALADLSDRYPRSVVNRTGWLIDHMANQLDVSLELEPLRAKVDRRTEPARLVASDPPRGPIDDTWNVYINGDVEHDL